MKKIQAPIFGALLIAQVLAAVQCDPKLKTLSVANQNLITTIEEWETFVNINPFFVLGIADSSCLSECCQSEPLLNQFNQLFTQSMLTYPDPRSSRKTIKIARIDLLNKQLFEDMGTDASLFKDRVSVFLVKNGQLQKYEGFLDVPAQFFHHMQRLVNPVVKLDSIEKAMRFKEVGSGVWKEDQRGTLLQEGELDQNIDKTVELLGFNTRVIAIALAEDNQEKLQEVTKVAEILAHRTNLRIGQITEQAIFSEFKREAAECLQGDNDQVVLYRYDSKCRSIPIEGSLSFDVQYLTRWISFNSAQKPDTLMLGSVQLADQATLNACMAIALIDQEAQGRELAYLLKDLDPRFDEDFMFFETRDQQKIAEYQTRVQGGRVDVPGIVVECAGQVYEYPPENPFMVSALEAWLTMIKIKVSGNTPVTDEDQRAFIKDFHMQTSQRSKEVNHDEL